MRLGWEIPNPVNALDGTETRFPFASLKPASESSEPEGSEPEGTEL